MQDFKSLRVWKESMRLSRRCYAVTDAFPSTERYGLVTQIRRAAVSVSSNIAEGCGRDSHKEFARFLRIAYGSACEVETQLLLARDLQLADRDELAALANEVETIRKMLSGLIRSATSAARNKSTPASLPGNVSAT